MRLRSIGMSGGGKSGIWIVNAPQFKAAVDQAAASWGLRAGDLMKTEMRLWMEDLLRDQEFNVPPSRMAGVKKMTADVYNIVQGIPPDAKYFERNGQVGVKLPNGAVWFVPKELFKAGDYGTFEARQFHRAHRQFGRNPSLPVGRRLHVRLAWLQKYVEESTGRVGRARAGWMPGADYFKAAKVPLWMKKAKERLPNEGHCGGSVDPQGNGELWVVNSVPYADRILRFYLDYTGGKRLRHLVGMVRAAQAKIAAQFSQRRAA
jgi:hypothetical protein